MTRSPLADLGVPLPVLAAPMAGGPTTPALVTAAARAGGLGFLAAGYLSAETLAGQLTSVRQHTNAFGVNLFAPNPVPIDPAAYRRFRALLQGDAERFGVTLPEVPKEDDDDWRSKIDVLLDEPVPIVSFTFGIPDPTTLAALRRVGTTLVQSVTSAAEARQAAAAGVDTLAVQAAVAGGHSATLTPNRTPPGTTLTDLVAEITHAVDLPVIAAGGITNSDQVGEILRQGAVAVMVGTVLLLSPESGATAAHRKGLTDPLRGDPVVTCAFTGRPARGLPNAFLTKYDDEAPLGYPALHHLTRPLRQASAAAGDPEFVNIWAGTGYRAATEEPAEQILRRLAEKL